MLSDLYTQKCSQKKLILDSQEHVKKHQNIKLKIGYRRVPPFSNFVQNVMAKIGKN
jgi:hypothetical protein